MTPKEKAMHIFNRMCNSVDELLPFDVKECAIVAVDEIDESQPYHLYNNEDKKQYWLAVKQEIEKL